MIESTNLVAKLLANENITVVMAVTSTASFNIKTRVLTLPQWKETTAEITGMLVGHEVGHALYTTSEYYTHDIKDKHFQGYLNVLEDVRIEKFMKRRYPGLRKTFTEGYKQLNEKDFFNVKTQDIQNLLLIDRINLYFKAGAVYNVSFKHDEMLFIERAERTETIQEVIDLAKDIYDFSKQEFEQNQKEKEQQEAEEPNEDEEDEDSDETADTSYINDSPPSDADDEVDYNTPARLSPSNQELEEDTDKNNISSKTESALKENIDDLADNSIEYRYLTLGKFGYDPIISYKNIIKDFELHSEKYPEYLSIDKEAVSQFKTSTSNVVNYLVKEFEMKKAASLYKRAKTSKVGQLDTRKLATYQLKNDIFKAVTTYKSGKNHGMIIIVDWSGSMDNCIKETIEQVINLAMFCARSQIPYQVFAFCDHYTNPVEYKKFQEMLAEQKSCSAEFNGENELSVNCGHLSLLELFSSKMSFSEMNRMIDILKCKRLQCFMPLNGTPLNESLAFIYGYLPKFKRQFNIEKLTFITLTDGAGSTLNVECNRQQNNIVDVRYEAGTNKRIQIKNFLVDQITKKSYKISTASYQQSNVLLSMIKETYNVTTLGFYLTGISRRSLDNAIRSHYGHWMPSNCDNLDRIKTEIRANGFASLKGTGRDDLFIVPLTGAKIIDDNLDKIDGDKTASQIARVFGRVLNTKKTSRILLNKFINYIA